MKVGMIGCGNISAQYLATFPSLPDVELVAVADIDLERAVMVGDRLMTDIRLATTAGMASAMPLTGESTREEAAALPPQERPTYVLERVDHLLPRDIWDQRRWPIE